MEPVLKIGLIGLDTSHAKVFADLLHDASRPDHVKGGRIVAAFPGGAPDIEKSWSRVERFTAILRDEHGVAILSSPAAVAEVCDVVFIESIDGRVHLPQLKEVLPFRRPMFVDKPMTTIAAEAREMFRLAEEAGVPLTSSSSLRYAEPLTAALRDTRQGAIVGCDVFGPMPVLDEPPGFFWYGIHAVEIAYAAMGAGCRSVSVIETNDVDVITAIWNDGRIAILRGSRKGHSHFGATLHRQNGAQHVALDNGAASTSPQLHAILQSLSRGQSDVPADETIEIIRFIEAANESKMAGKSVLL